MCSWQIHGKKHIHTERLTAELQGVLVDYSGMEGVVCARHVRQI